MEVKNKDTHIRCVHRKTGEVAYNLASNVNNKYWQKSTGFSPQPEPKAEDFGSIAQKADASKDLTKETKTTTNAKTTETIKNG